MEWWSDVLDYEEDAEENSLGEIYDDLPAPTPVHDMEEKKEDKIPGDMYTNLPAVPEIEEGEILESGTQQSGPNTIPADNDKTSGISLGTLIQQRYNGPMCHIKHKQMKKTRGHLLKGILGPPIVDSYMRNLITAVTRTRWNKELEKKQRKLGHSFSEAIAACYTITRAADVVLPCEDSEEHCREIQMLLRYAGACLCNALHEWRTQRRAALLHKLLSPKHWLCKLRGNRGSSRLFGKALARDLGKHVFPSRRDRISTILRDEIKSHNKGLYFHCSQSQQECLKNMETWVERGCDVFAEKDKLEEAGISLEKFMLPTKLEKSAIRIVKSRHDNIQKKQLWKSENKISCDLTNAANAFMTILMRMAPESRLCGLVDVGIHFACVALYKFDRYRRTAFLSSLRLSRERVEILIDQYPVEQNGNLIGESLLTHATK